MKVPKLPRHVGRMSKTIIISFMVAAGTDLLDFPILTVSAKRCIGTIR